GTVWDHRLDHHRRHRRGNREVPDAGQGPGRLLYHHIARYCRRAAGRLDRQSRRLVRHQRRCRLRRRHRRRLHPARHLPADRRPAEPRHQAL
ncbi:MAG: Transglycosylase associated protein, partial [uncultured Sphingomonas sp.]